MAKTQKYYVVWKGRKPGIYDNWDECKAQVDGFFDAKYKSFATRQLAEQAHAQAYSAHIPDRKPGDLKAAGAAPVRRSGNFIADSFSVDAACSGNPGLLEYQCVHTTTGEVIFKRGPFKHGTNNIGEFLAIVRALAVCKQRKLPQPIYSDSKIAIGWVKSKTCRTKLALTKSNVELFQLIEQAEKWLQENTCENRILKWETEEWGENPADFGRK
jgi:ribonuclease HI